MNWLERKAKKDSDVNRLSCELLLGPSYCSGLLDGEPSRGVSRQESFRDRCKERDELKAVLYWLSCTPFLGHVSKQDLTGLYRLALSNHISARIEDKFEKKLESWGDRLLRSLIHSFGGR
jgi:hypothetical protein